MPMISKIEYMLIMATSLEELQELVNTYLAKGWDLQGEVIIQDDEELYQEIYKEIEQ